MFLQVSNSKAVRSQFLSSILMVVLLALTVAAQNGYKKAPPEVSSILSAPVTPTAV